MTFYKKSILFTIFFIFLEGCITSHSSIQNITKYSEIPKDLIGQKSLVLLDIDNTIFRTDSHYGSVEHFEHLTEKEVKENNLTYKQTKLKLTPFWEQAQGVVNTKLIDPEIDSFIKYSDMHSNIIGFTARPPSTKLKKLTLNQLKNHKIFLSELTGFKFSKTYEQQIFPDDHWCERNTGKCNKDTKKIFHQARAEFDKGVLFANDINSKGEVFIDFYRKYSEYTYAEFYTFPTKIIFVDDKMYNLESMKKYAKDNKINFYGFLIESKFNFDPKIAEKEEKEKHK